MSNKNKIRLSALVAIIGALLLIGSATVGVLIKMNEPSPSGGVSGKHHHSATTTQSAP